jgi:hypothetical protein
MRQLSDLEKNALKFWPEQIAAKERNSSIIPKLIETQDKFISLLNFADASPFVWKDALKTSGSLSANLFLKHLLVLSDIGGERLMRFKKELPSLFPSKFMIFTWRESQYEYFWQSLHGNKNWNNSQLKVDGDGLSKNHELSELMEDVIMLLLFGSTVLSSGLPNEIEEKCMIGTLIGQKQELDIFVKQRYIWVSRITGGATSNALGNLAQQYVLEYLKNKLPDWDFSKKTLPNITQNDRTLTNFDMVATSPTGNCCAIEASFQVTTNSVIERKAGQAQARLYQLNDAGHVIAYIIDGAGNFQRTSALRTICQYSNCTVTYKDCELDLLVDFLIEFEKTKTD